MTILSPIYCSELRIVWERRDDRIAHRIEIARRAVRAPRASMAARRSAEDLQKADDGAVEDYEVLLESIEGVGAGSAEHALASEGDREQAATAGDVAVGGPHRALSGAWPPSPPLQECHGEKRGDTHVALGVGRAGKTHFAVAIESSDVPRPTITCDVAARVTTAPVAEVQSYLGSSYLCPGGWRVLDAATIELRPGVFLRIAEESTCMHLDALRRTLSIEPRVPLSGRASQTLRWRYGIEEVEVAE